MCNCKSEIEKRLVERAKDHFPSSTDVKVELQGYAFILGENLGMKNVMSFEVEHTAVVKGVPKRKKIKQSMIGNYCMFCGKSYDKSEEESEPLAG